MRFGFVSSSGRVGKGEDLLLCLVCAEGTCYGDVYILSLGSMVPAGLFRLLLWAFWVSARLQDSGLFGVTVWVPWAQAGLED